jgi:hypothetical protein
MAEKEEYEKKAKEERDRKVREEKEAKEKTEALVLEEKKLKELEIARLIEEEERARVEEAARNPYEGMTYEQLTLLIDQTTASVEAAVATKDYKLCESLEATLIKLNGTRILLPVPQPKLTRVEVLEKIASTQVGLGKWLGKGLGLFPLLAAAGR